MLDVLKNTISVIKTDYGPDEETKISVDSLNYLAYAVL